MKLDIKNIKELAENIDKYGLNEVFVESEGVKITLKREKNVEEASKIVYQPSKTNEIPEETASSDAYQESDNDNVADEYDTINAPMVGTFYRSPSPGSPSFVSEGQSVDKGSTVCILEAMKLMNEVKTEKKCEIVKILVEDGQVVRKGDKLIAIK